MSVPVLGDGCVCRRVLLTHEAEADAANFLPGELDHGGGFDVR